MLDLRNRIVASSQQNQRRSVVSFARPHDLVYALANFILRHTYAYVPMRSLPPLSLVFHVTRCSNANPEKDESGCPLLQCKMPNRPSYQLLQTLLNEYAATGRQLKRCVFLVVIYGCM